MFAEANLSPRYIFPGRVKEFFISLLIDKVRHEACGLVHVFSRCLQFQVNIIFTLPSDQEDWMDVAASSIEKHAKKKI